MAKNVVNVIKVLASNEMIGRLLQYEDSYNMKLMKPIPSQIMNPKNDDCRIFPFPFDVEATDVENSFIRVYYNSGGFNENETIAEAKIHIDIIVPKGMWLLNNGKDSLIRPYDIMGRVIDLVGRNSVGHSVKLNFEGYQHLYINTKFDCIRLYAEYMSVETGHY